jgi:histidine ammonia-lyase
MTVEFHRPGASATLDGTTLTCEKVRDIARGNDPVTVTGAGLDRARRARDAVHAAMATQPVYGRTTGVGANRSIRVRDGGHGLRLLRSHAGGAGPLLAAPLARAMLVVRLNQLAAGGSGVDPELLPVLAEVLSRGLIPPVRTVGAIGTGDLGALASTALCLIGERPWLGGLGATLPPFALDPADALAFMSSNAATIGEGALAAADLAGLIAATPVVAALSFLVVRGSDQPYAVPVQRARPHRGQAEVAERMRLLLAGQEVQAARIQDPYGYRALPQVHGPAVDAVRSLGEVLAVELNAAAENPLVDADSGQILHNGNFYTAYLGLALDAARLAVFQTAALSAARLGTLVEPRLTGLRPFLASSIPASSGVLALEYVAHSALADIRRLASPATLGTAVLSRGLEELADFSTQAARAATDTVAAYRIVLACELVAAVRGLRLRRLEPAAGPLRDAFALAAPALDTRIADRPLDADIDAAEGVLAGLARVLGVSYRSRKMPWPAESCSCWRSRSRARAGSASAMAWMSTAASTVGAAWESNSRRPPTPAGRRTSASPAKGTKRTSLITAVRMPRRRANRSACTVSAG